MAWREESTRPLRVMDSFVPKKSYARFAQKTNGTDETGGRKRPNAGQQTDDESSVKRARTIEDQDNAHIQHLPKKGYSQMPGKGYVAHVPKKGYAHIPKKGYHRVENDAAPSFPQKGYQHLQNDVNPPTMPKKGYHHFQNDGVPSNAPKKGYHHFLNEPAASLLPKKGYGGKGYPRASEKEDESATQDKEIPEDKNDDIEYDQEDEGADDDSSSEEDSDSESSSEEDDDDDEEEDEHYTDGFGDDLMGDAEDRKKLMAMTEVEREAILMDRRYRREAMLDYMKLRRELKEKKKSSKKGKEKKTRKLKKVGNRRRLDDSSEEEREKDDGDSDYVDEASSRGEMSTQGVVGQSSNWGESVLSRSPEYKAEIKLTPEDLNPVRIPRNLVMRWFDEPFFEDAMTGSYVRYCLGTNRRTQKTTYRVCKVTGMGPKYKRFYKLGNKITTDRTLLLEVGGVVKACKLDMISNSRFTDREVECWMKLQRDALVDLPTKEELSALKNRIHDTVYNHQYTEQQVADLITQRQKRHRRINNFGAELIDIEEALAIIKDKEAESLTGQNMNVNMEELQEEREKLEARLEKLREMEEKHNMKRTNKFATKINQRNRKYNTEQARKTSRLQEKIAEKVQKDEYDPFKRRETTVETLWLTKPDDETTKKKKATSPIEQESKTTRSAQSEVVYSRVVASEMGEDIMRKHDFDDTELALSDKSKKSKKKKKKKKTKSDDVGASSGKKKKAISLSEWRKRRMAKTS